MVLYIKYMVSQRCKQLVQQELSGLHIEYSEIHLGSVHLRHLISSHLFNQLQARLLLSGLELLDDKRIRLFESIRELALQMAYQCDELPRITCAAFLSKNLSHDYSYMANLFAEVEGMSIQHFIIHHKIERVKKLLLHDAANLTEIASQLQYSSVAHLSHQFKKVTGITPTAFKQLSKK